MDRRHHGKSNTLVGGNSCKVVATSRIRFIMKNFASNRIPAVNASLLLKMLMETECAAHMALGHMR